jgi:hypothetical protein
MPCAASALTIASGKPSSVNVALVSGASSLDGVSWVPSF